MPSFNVSSLPGLNACLNSASTVFLVTGYFCIRRGKVLAHKTCMVSAFFCSAVFLASYIYYHLHVGVVRFGGQGWVRPVYFTILTTHTILAVVIVPLVLVTLYRALTNNFVRHKRIAHWTLPLWLYVSVTGVVIYWLLFRVYAPITAAALQPVAQ